MHGLSRRLFLGGLASSCAAARAYARPAADRLPTLAVIDAEVRRITGILGSEARTQRLGRSRSERPIDLVSIGRGPNAVLLVGAPHANEPIGLLTILRLMERLAHDRALRQDGGFSFHFIPAIDIDGVALNEGWLEAPRTPDHYLRHFFRPAFADQPEYSFPLDMPGYRFSTPTPENLCWQEALEQTRPMLQCPLHGSDANGVFYLVTSRRQALADRLSRLPGTFGLAINRIGEPGLGTESYAPGVFSEFAVKSMIEDLTAEGKDPRAVWNAGQSSSEYALQRFGTFSLICEVALWDDQRLYSERASSMNMADVTRDALAQLREDKALFAFARSLRPRLSPEAQALDAALVEAHSRIDTRIEALTMEKDAAEDDVKPLAERDLVQYEPGLSAMRAAAMLARRAGLSDDISIAAKAQAVVARRLKSQLSKAPLTPIPYTISADLQMEATLIAADMLAQGKP
ncbi:M14 family zinc carboxypeptidase [Sphingosinicella soli]|uniref:Peptidase M14 domain-containing protein n=1 Tax=Sphingosinicella soli TaxID=333708 RepID=A0A7W7F7R8_9SPHN|nr:M14 family zinc carboxypeptidase [Sphingosinicella soli]MBB4632944.1 hypothetical protein [Sphingosinicella soli]